MSTQPSQPGGPPPASELRAALEMHRPTLVRAMWFGLVSSLLILAPTWYMMEAYGRVVTSRNHFTLFMITLMVLFALGVMELLSWVRGRMLQDVSESVDDTLSPRIYRAMFRANQLSPGLGNTQPLADLRTIREFMSSPAVGALPDIPAAVVFLILLFILSPALGTLALVAAIVQVSLAWGNERQTLQPLSQANQLQVSANQSADDMLRNAEAVRAMGMMPTLFGRWRQAQDELLRLQGTASDRAGGYAATTKFVQTVLSSALLGLAAYLLLNNALWGGGSMLIVGSVLGGRVLAPLVQLVAQWRSVVNARQSWGRLDLFLKTVPADPQTMSLPPPTGALTVEGLSAHPPGKPQTPLVRNVQFGLRPGQTLAVAGPSGSGKSTLARLLVGAWPPATGKVRLDGADVFSWNKEELGPHIGYLPQGVELLDGTVADNIARFSEPHPGMVEEAARAVGLHDWITSLPEGYDTVLGTDGARLSGGQRQRIGLARALYGKPKLVVLDEPNSSLDEAGELALSKAIADASKAGCTFVIVTHRTHILAVCSHLLVLSDGAQMVVGPREEVIAAMKDAADKQAAAARAAAGGGKPAAPAGLAAGAPRPLQINATPKGTAA
ncbi:MAG: type I secretion system permease/ATPase [Comamonadaceae bacterium]|nr:MAG: type I secretion system permease/ATPase [Comamonadaceae bacterium]